MKAKIAVLAVTFACLWRGADSVRAQQPYPGGGFAYPVQTTTPYPGTVAPVQFAQPMSGYAAGVQMSVPGASPAMAPMPVPYYPGGQPVMAAASIQPVPAGGPATPGGLPTGIQPQPVTWPAANSACDASGQACDANGSACDDCGELLGDCQCGGGLRGAWCRLRSGSSLFDHEGCLDRWHGHVHSHLHQYFSYPRAVRVWGGVEGLWWWNKDRSLPVLATTSTIGTPFNQAGVLGEPNTSVLFGGGEFDDDASEGIRGTLGFWFDREQNMGIFARAFRFGEEEIGYHAASSGDPILARPFFDVAFGIQDALVVAYPGIAEGRLDIQTSNEARGYDVLLRKLLYYGDCNRIDLIGGYHRTELMDDVHIAHQIVSIDPQGRVPVGTRINTLDSFEAENDFNGGSIGVMAQGFDGRLTWNLLSKISFGNNRERVAIRGSSTTTVPGGGSASFDQGLLALDSNSGVYERDQFAFVPELDVSVMYNICSMLSVSVGYSAIYWSDIALAGPAIDTSINPTQIGGPVIGPALPTYSLVDDDFWLHGLTFGVHGRF